MRIFSRIEINHFVLNLSRIIWFILLHHKFKKTRQNNSAENAHFMFWPNQFQKIRQIKAWYYRIDMTNPLRSYNCLGSFMSCFIQLFRYECHSSLTTVYNFASNDLTGNISFQTAFHFNFLTLIFHDFQKQTHNNKQQLLTLSSALRLLWLVLLSFTQWTRDANFVR